MWEILPFMQGKPEGFVIMVPQNEAWAKLIEACFPDAKRVTRYAIKKDTRYRQGIEIEVDTVESERRKHLATAACAALILDCLKDNLYPSWDAQNMNSVRLAEKLGYEYSHDFWLVPYIIGMIIGMR